MASDELKAEVPASAHAAAEESFIAASGPGGQNVNKVATAVQLKVNIYALRLPPPVSIAFQLVADWYRQQSGEDLEQLVRAAGSWLSRKVLK